MTYNPSIPGPNDDLSLSQGQIQTNFSQANSLIARDHYAFNDNNNALRAHHRKVQFDLPIADPTISGVIGTLYTKADVNDTSTRSQIFYRNITEILQVTNRFHFPGTAPAPTIPPIDPPTHAAGYLMLQGGIIVMWNFEGIISSGGGAWSQTHTVDFPAITNYAYTGGQTQGFPNNCFSVVTTVSAQDTTTKTCSVKYNSTTKEHFVLKLSSLAIDGIYYIAIGN